MASDATAEVSRICAEFDSAVASDIAGLKRRQLYFYYDLSIHVQDFVGDDAAKSADRAGADPRVRQLAAELSPYVAAYDPDIADDRALTFYQWEGDSSTDDEVGLHSTVIVNRIQDAALNEVARLFEELDKTDFPHQMGTRRRQLLCFNGVYFHIQDFERQNGNAVIDQAWKEADPRFVKICEDLDPLVQKYAPEKWRSIDDQIAVRYYYWEAPA